MQRPEISMKFLFLSMLSIIFLSVCSTARAEVAVDVSVHIAPPVYPVYAQPVCPVPGYIWSPGYWAYGDEGYYWVPGVWVISPHIGWLWTPGYWGWADGAYVWHGGYWGRHVGFYGGINYGYGYTGVGFTGGYWRSGVFCYNRSVTNVNVAVVHNTYSTRVVNKTVAVNRVSYNGGTGGVVARPTAVELVAAKEPHRLATVDQLRSERIASRNREMFASVNNGRPSETALAKHAASYQQVKKVNQGSRLNPDQRNGPEMQQKHFAQRNEREPKESSIR